MPVRVTAFFAETVGRRAKLLSRARLPANGRSIAGVVRDI